MALDKHVMACSRHCGVIQSILTALKIICAPLIHLSFLSTPGNHCSFNSLHSFPFSRRSCFDFFFLNIASWSLKFFLEITCGPLVFTLIKAELNRFGTLKNASASMCKIYSTHINMFWRSGGHSCFRNEKRN